MTKKNESTLRRKCDAKILDTLLFSSLIPPPLLNDIAIFVKIVSITGDNPIDVTFGVLSSLILITNFNFLFFSPNRNLLRNLFFNLTSTATALPISQTSSKTFQASEKTVTASLPSVSGISRKKIIVDKSRNPGKKTPFFLK